MTRIKPPSAIPTAKMREYIWMQGQEDRDLRLALAAYELAVALGLLDDSVMPTPQLLSGVRNWFAHKPSTKLANTDLEKLRKTMKGSFKEIFEDYLQAEPITGESPAHEKELLRRFLWAVHKWITVDVDTVSPEYRC